MRVELVSSLCCVTLTCPRSKRSRNSFSEGVGGTLPGIPVFLNGSESQLRVLCSRRKGTVATAVQCSQTVTREHHAPPPAGQQALCRHCERARRSVRKAVPFWKPRGLCEHWGLVSLVSRTQLTPLLSLATLQSRSCLQREDQTRVACDPVGSLAPSSRRETQKLTDHNAPACVPPQQTCTELREINEAMRPQVGQPGNKPNRPRYV